MKKLFIILFLVFFLTPTSNSNAATNEQLFSWLKSEMNLPSDFPAPTIYRVSKKELKEIYIAVVKPAYDKMIEDGIGEYTAYSSMELFSTVVRAFFIKRLEVIFIRFSEPDHTVVHEMVHWVQFKQNRLSKVGTEEQKYQHRMKMEFEARTYEYKYKEEN